MAKLDLSKTGVVETERATQLKTAFDIIEEIEEYFEDKMGISAYSQPAVVPQDLSEGLAERADALTLDELGVLHAQYVAYAAFLNGRLSNIKAGYKLAEMNLRHIKADISTKLFAKKVPKAEVADRVLMDGLYREFEVEYLKLYMMRVMLEARYTAYHTQANAISRLITLRGQELEQGRQNPQQRDSKGGGPDKGRGGGRPRPRRQRPTF